MIPIRSGLSIIPLLISSSSLYPKNKGMSPVAWIQRNLHSINRTQDIPSRFQIVLRTFDPLTTGQISQEFLCFSDSDSISHHSSAADRSHVLRVIADNLIILIYDIHSMHFSPTSIMPPDS